MANTIMSAKNSFQEGLIMDFSPDNTQATCMTSALNATLLTFNGNEMQLQNDMGNGRVETAFLPEGYIPVGSCEFGDIIYIVSYNPLTNKSQIGCFPSPERNISSEEIGNMKQILSWKDFQDTDDGQNPNGKLIASSVKKILFDSRDMTPGDKYIIYAQDLNNNNKGLSDYGNSDHEHGRFPKLAKVHVVSIEESGKIVYLDSTTKWYDNDYYLNADLSVNGEIKDLDSYRDLVSSAYSIFSSKVSGKLAILVELEKITGFSCSWSPYGKTNGEYTDYDIYWNFSWTTDDNNINPTGAVITYGEWEGPIAGKGGHYRQWLKNNNDGTIYLDNNYISINTTINTKEWEFSRKYKLEDIIKNPITYKDFITNYEYNNYLNNTLKSLSTKGIEPNKINIDVDKATGYPVQGKYYVNCSKIIKNVPQYQDANGVYHQGSAVSINDDIVNNHFHYPIIKKFETFKIPTKNIITVGVNKTVEKEPDISNLIYHYKIAPTMPYGILEEFTQEGYIDFSKIGKKSIFLNTWKYYNYENTITLTWGMEAYTEPQKGISEVVFEFYDNQGFVGAYHNKDKMSYNGVFTEYITLGESGSNYKFNNIPAFPDTTYILGNHPIPKPEYHKGIKVRGDAIVEGITYLDDNKNVVTTFDPNTEYFQDDSATLYPNCLYLVKIITKYCDKNVLGEYIEPIKTETDKILVEYRWLWTNTLFNEYYYQVKDFEELQAQLTYDINALYSQKNQGNLTSKALYKGDLSGNNTKIGETEYEQLSANVIYVNQDGSADKDGNINCQLQIGLQNTHNTFNIEQSKLNLIKVDVHFGRDYLTNTTPEIVTNEELGYIFDGVYPLNKNNNCDEVAKIDTILGKKLFEAIGMTGGTAGNEINSKEDSYKNYLNMFSVNFPTKYNYLKSGPELLVYPPHQGELPESGINVIKYSDIPLDQMEYTLGNKYLNLTLTGILYNKFYSVKETLNTSATVVRPLLYSKDDLPKYNMIYDNNHFYLNNLAGLVLGNDIDGNDQHKVRFYKLEAALDSLGNRYWVQPLGNNLGDDGGETKAVSRNIFEEFQVCDSGRLNDLFPGITPLVLTYENNAGGDKYNIVKGKVTSNKSISNSQAIGIGKYNKGFSGKPSNYVGIYNDMSNLNTQNTYLFLMLKDSKDIVHILNTAIPVTYSNGRINQVVRGAPSGTTVGDLIASVLMNLYYTQGDQESNIPYQGISNFVKLSRHTYTYVKDIIFKIKQNNSNELIVMSKMNYSDYIQQILNNQSLQLDPTIRQSLESHKNINFQLLSILKNCPLQISFDYIDPIQDLVLTPKELIKVADGNTIYTNQGFINNRLYIQDIKNPQSFIRLDASQNFEYHSYKDFKEHSSGQLLGVQNTEILQNSSFKRGFGYDQGQLVCLKSNSNSAHNGNSLSISGYLSGNHNGWGSIWPIYADENLLIEGKLS